jgi:Fe2+ transport system protein FeoA
MSTLDRLELARCAVIDDVIDADATVLRLVEMGMTAMTPVIVTRRAPLGDPLEIEVRGTRLCLRRGQAACFTVRIPSPSVRRPP